ncbi:MAG: hypothetical protein DRI56_09905 [Chloroflexota bacterium]|nr:MAG: hypothetical protein DRI56_09905 [Chloroflexota bacterium]
MALHYDSKGKFYTNYITKDVIPTVIQTVTQLIKGDVYVRPEERLSDEMNGDSQFIAITNASVFDNQGECLYRVEFLTINKEHIIWLSPEENFSVEEVENES